MKIVAIVQARMGSKRLPGKVLKKINGKSLIELLLCRLSRSKFIDEICVAIPTNKENNFLSKEITRLGYRLFRGSEKDVLTRFYNAASYMQANIIVRITGDCPLVDPDIVDGVINLFLEKKTDYASNVNPPTFPDGLDVEVFKMSVLEIAQNRARKLYDREHVTPLILKSDFSKINYEAKEDLSRYRLTVDEKEDLDLVSKIFKHFAPNLNFRYTDIINYLVKNPNLININNDFLRNEASYLGTGQKLWNRAKKIIPGGSMLLSKRSEMHLPNKWPSYFSKTKGCIVWDLDGNQLIDTYYMGFGTNILGYSHPEIDSAVKDAISKGNLSTLNAPEEVWLAEKLLEINPWAGCARFARSGGEANAIAIRIARAVSGKDGIAVCGYHGWHDWYLSANLGNDDALANHLLPGLSTNGVPRALRGIVHPFNYNDFEGLKLIIEKNSIGVVKMEVMRSIMPKNNFLQKIRKLCNEKGIVLIFDECTSGFRETFGGLHSKFKVYPDIAVYGKTLGNGYAISAVICKSEMLNVSKNAFISSTFWTERIGSVAGLQTLKIMETVKPWIKVTQTGKLVQDIWMKLALKYNLEISVSGLPSLSTFSFQAIDNQKYKTFITQEMLKKGFLAGAAFYVCTEHSEEILNKYEDNLDPIFEKIGNCENGDLDIDKLLKGDISHIGFKRLN